METPPLDGRNRLQLERLAPLPPHVPPLLVLQLVGVGAPFVRSIATDEQNITFTSSSAAALR